jgi:hypothetical protein
MVPSFYGKGGYGRKKVSDDSNDQSNVGIVGNRPQPYTLSKEAL